MREIKGCFDRVSVNHKFSFWVSKAKIVRDFVRPFCHSFPLLLVMILFSFSLLAKEKADGEFDVSEVIMHHVLDSYEWHFFTAGGHHYSISLPVIIYKSEGWDVFLSSRFHNPEGTYGDYRMEHGKIVSVSGSKFYDLSVTKNVLFIFIAGTLLLLVFISLARRYKKNPMGIPIGLQSFVEPVIVFIQDEIAKPNIGRQYLRFMPFLLTIFFFILFSNLLGLVPSGPNITGAISVTMALASLSFVLIQINGNKNYWKHIFNTPGVPWWLKFGIPIMPVVEIVGVLVKPIALMVRLFANITAGHIIIISLICLIFIIGGGGESALAGYSVSPFVVAFILFIMCLELFVALLQAYIFTLLSAIFIGAATEEHH